MKSLVAGDLRLLGDRPAARFDLMPPVLEIGDLKGDVRPRLVPIDPVLQADVQLEAACIEPDPIRLEHRRAVNLAEAHEADVKLPRAFEFRTGNVHLSVIDACNHVCVCLNELG